MHTSLPDNTDTCQQTKKHGDSRKLWIVSILDEKEQTWGCTNAGSAFSLLILLPHSSFLPIISSPSTVSNFSPFYLLYLPAGPAPHSSCQLSCSMELHTGRWAGKPKLEGWRMLAADVTSQESSCQILTSFCWGCPNENWLEFMIWTIHVFLEIAEGAYLIPKMPFSLKAGRS